MTSTKGSHPNDRGEPNASGLLRQTMRTVGLLVAACVLFVGVLSVLAVSITSRAVNGPGSSAAQASDTNEHTKKPLSI